jgi:peroxin-14
MSRAELVHNAVAFLRDPSVAESPLAKRVAFLENKGLNQAEIDEALRIASQPNDAGGRSPPPFLLQQHQQQGRDWRDWFIMTVVGGTVGYFVVSLARVCPAVSLSWYSLIRICFQKYLLPALAPPTATQLTAAQEALAAKYDEAAALLETLQADTAAVRADVAEQSRKVDEGLGGVKDAVREVRLKEERRDEEMREIRLEVDSVRDMLPKVKQGQNPSPLLLRRLTTSVCVDA